MESLSIIGRLNQQAADRAELQKYREKEAAYQAEMGKYQAALAEKRKEELAKQAFAEGRKVGVQQVVKDLSQPRYTENELYLLQKAQEQAEQARVNQGMYKGEQAYVQGNAQEGAEAAALRNAPNRLMDGLAGAIADDDRYNTDEKRRMMGY